MHRIRLMPGTMGVCGLAIDLFGIERVEVGEWTTPVYVTEVTGEEIEAARQLLADRDVNIEIVTSTEIEMRRKP